MPNLRDIRNHITSVQSIAKVTRALEEVSGVKGRRLQARVESTYGFADRSWQVLNHLAACAGEVVRENPFFRLREVHSLGMLLITSDRGMVGPADENVFMAAMQHVSARGVEAKWITIGRIGRANLLQREQTIHADFPHNDRADITQLTPVARLLMDGFANGTFDEAWIAYTQFRPGARLKPIVRRLLPIQADQPSTPRFYVFEPSPQEILDELIPRIVQFQIYEAFLEALTSEHVARNAAMHAATKNASELLQHLRLTYNKTRQQQITAEILDILGGSLGVEGESV